MSVTEHDDREWTLSASRLNTSGVTYPPVINGPEIRGAERVKVVSVSQLQGAVEERDELRRVLANLREHAINDGAMEAGGGYDVTVLQPLLGGQ